MIISWTEMTHCMVWIWTMSDRHCRKLPTISTSCLSRRPCPSFFWTPHGDIKYLCTSKNAPRTSPLTARDLQYLLQTREADYWTKQEDEQSVRTLSLIKHILKFLFLFSSLIRNLQVTCYSFFSNSYNILYSNRLCCMKATRL